MKYFKRLLLAFIIVFSIFGLAGCKGKAKEIIFITDKGSIHDKSFNQGAYDGVKEFASKHKLTYGYIRPTEASVAEYIASIEYAVSNGAKVIVAAGYLFEVPVNAMQKAYPDVKFILLDGSPKNAPNGSLDKNVHSVFYAEEESGFLAGYATIHEGYRNLGFLGGMAVPPVQRFGLGYIQGVKYAARELCLEEGAVAMQYRYTGDFVDNQDSRDKAKEMYDRGVEIIFACGGMVSSSVIYVAEETKNFVIGVDVDQSYDSPTVVTSAMKNLKESVEMVLKSIYEDETWDEQFAGQESILTAKDNGVGLPFKTSRFNTFTEEQYEAILDKIINSEIEISKETYKENKISNIAEDYSDELLKIIYIE